MFRITRDAEGRAEAIRLQLGGWGLRDRLRRAIAALPALPWASSWPVRQVARSTRAMSRGVRRGVPRVSYRRDPAGRVDAFVLRFGPESPSVGASMRATVRERWAQARDAVAAFQSGLSGWMPRPVLDRDAWGRVAAVRIGIGAPAMPGAIPVEPEGRGPKWVIEPLRGGIVAQVEEFFRHRKTLWYFAQQALRKMYKGTRLGPFWLFARPLLPIVITTLVVGRLLGVPSEGVPYFLFFLAGTTSWALFERSVQWATRSLSLQKSVIKKVYFPRIIVPVASVAPALADAFSYTGLLIVASLYYLVHDAHWYLRVGPAGLLMAVFAALLSVLLAIGVGLWTSVWQARAREIRYTLGYVMRFWNYLTPVMYPLSEIPPKYQWVMYLNPMASLVETFKWGVLGIGELNIRALASGVVVVLAVLASGVWYFNRSEAVTVDRL